MDHLNGDRWKINDEDGHKNGEREGVFPVIFLMAAVGIRWIKYRYKDDFGSDFSDEQFLGKPFCHSSFSLTEMNENRFNKRNSYDSITSSFI